MYCEYRTVTHRPHTVTATVTRGRARRRGAVTQYSQLSSSLRAAAAPCGVCLLCALRRAGSRVAGAGICSLQCSKKHFWVRSAKTTHIGIKIENARKQELGLGAGSGRDGHYEGSGLPCGVPSPPLTSAARIDTICVFCVYLYPETLARVIGPTQPRTHEPGRPIFSCRYHSRFWCAPSR